MEITDQWRSQDFWKRGYDSQLQKISPTPHPPPPPHPLPSPIGYATGKDRRLNRYSLIKERMKVKGRRGGEGGGEEGVGLISLCVSFVYFWEVVVEGSSGRNAFSRCVISLPFADNPSDIRTLISSFSVSSTTHSLTPSQGSDGADSVPFERTVYQIMEVRLYIRRAVS